VAAFALITCDHGFGHVRRCALIAGELAARGEAVTLFTPSQAVARFGSLAAGVVVVDFATATTVEALRDGRAFASCWTERLPSLDGFDVVVSDNLPEILKVRPDAVLSGSFLWHLVLSGIDPRIAAQAESLLAAHRPRMIASSLFGMPDLAARTRLTTVGLCVAAPRPPSCGDDLLIACGGSAGMESAFRDLVGAVASGPPTPFPIVWVEPRLLPPGAPPWMRPATFDEAMYRRLAAAVVRAGVGTLTDCVWAGARVFATWEPGNAELTFNAGRFAELGIGDAAASPGDAFVAACAYATDLARRAAHAAATRQVDFDGVRETAELLVGHATLPHD